MNANYKNDIEKILELSGKSIANASVKELYEAVSRAACAYAYKNSDKEEKPKRASYLSAEFLVGRLIYSNLMNLGLLDDTKAILESEGRDIGMFEEIEDDALGNGGLGRLAACFLDSAATHDIPLDGYGIRYRYGLFKQRIENGFQKEYADDWLSCGDPWSVRREDEKILINYADQKVWAVPYDMPVIGYGGKTVNTLRLWQSEPVCNFDFDKFNRNLREESVAERTKAEQISDTLYPNDETEEGKRLRLKQQYFFSAASVRDMVRKYEAKFGSEWGKFPETYAIQLNDTHPVVAIPELMRILVDEKGLDFESAFAIAQKTFAYTNHTVMAEALEKWSTKLFFSVVPEVYDFVVMIDRRMRDEFMKKGIKGKDAEIYHIITGGVIHMARLAIYAGHSINGVAWLHTEILKDDALKEWYAVYPERFNNKTNGITQRRWLALANPQLSKFIKDRIGDGFIKNLDELKKLEAYLDDDKAIEEFMQIKKAKKEELSAFVKAHDGKILDSAFIFDIQIKRLHEYKRQFMNALSILYIYYAIKDGRVKNMNPTAFIFGAKAAPGYYRAKGIIKLINEIGNLVNSDPDVNDKMQVIFVENYNVTYAEKLTPAADISEQISTAGTEASGTGNMKFMLNGAVTLGTYDGANVEIVREAGEENNYIFGARVEDIKAIENTYDPMKIYNEDANIKKVMDSLIDGTLDDNGTGMFRELYNAILKGAHWHKPDHYYILLDLVPYCERKLQAIADYSDSKAFARKCLANVANAGAFSSDRTIIEYAREIWNV